MTTTSGAGAGASSLPTMQGGRNKGIGVGAGAAAGAGVSAMTGGSATAVHESLMSVATAMVSAAVVLPPALWISFQFRLSTGKPQNLEKAAAEWDTAANELQQAAEDLRNLVKGIPDTAWNMDDRGAYEGKVNDYCQQLDVLQQYLSAVAMSLKVLAYALLIYSIFAMGMAVYIDTLFVLAVAALASVAGAPGYPAILSAATVGAWTTVGATSILAAAGTITGGVMFAKAGLTADVQAAHGNANAHGAFKEAFTNGIRGTAANLVQNGANAGLAFVNRSNGQTIRGGLPGGKSAGHGGVPLSSIDLDADRGIDETWTYGYGAKLAWNPQHETEVAANIKHNDEGWAGGEVGVTHKYTHPSGQAAGSVGGKLTWDENENFGGSAKAGAENPTTGSKAEYEGTREPGGDYHDKYVVQSPVVNHEGSWAEKDQPKKDETPPWDK